MKPGQLNNVMKEMLSCEPARDGAHHAWHHSIETEDATTGCANIQGLKASPPPSSEISTDGQDTWQGSQTTDGRLGLQNGLRDNRDLEDDQERDGATTSLATWGRRTWPRLARDRVRWRQSSERFLHRERDIP